MLRSILTHCPEHSRAQAGRPWASFLEAHMHQADQGTELTTVNFWVLA